MGDLNWEWFNVLTFGTIFGVDLGIKNLEEMKRRAALHCVQRAHVMPSIECVGLFVVVYPLTIVHALHLHIVDMDNVGPTFEKLSYKLLPVDDAIQVLREEKQDLEWRSSWQRGPSRTPLLRFRARGS